MVTGRIRLPVLSIWDGRNTGMGGGNRYIYFRYPGHGDQQIDFDIGGTPNILIFKHSVTDNIRQAWMNGTSKGAKTASISAPTIGGSF